MSKIRSMLHSLIPTRARRRYDEAHREEVAAEETFTMTTNQFQAIKREFEAKQRNGSNGTTRPQAQVSGGS